MVCLCRKTNQCGAIAMPRNKPPPSKRCQITWWLGLLEGTEVSETTA